MRSGAKKRSCPARRMAGMLISDRGMRERASPAVKITWSSFPVPFSYTDTVSLNNFSISISMVSMFERSTCTPHTLSAADGYDVLREDRAEVRRKGVDEEIVMEAPNSRQASATAKPMPDVPPMMRMRELCSLLTYFIVMFE